MTDKRLRSSRDSNSPSLHETQGDSSGRRLQILNTKRAERVAQAASCTTKSTTSCEDLPRLAALGWRKIGPAQFDRATVKGAATFQMSFFCPQTAGQLNPTRVATP